jgi:hypothetical protein
MAEFRYNELAELFTGKVHLPPRAADASPKDAARANMRSAQRKAMTYRRFATGAEAIRFAIEVLPAEGLAASVLEIDGDRFDPEAIRSLYDGPAYPLPRRRRPQNTA